MIYFDRIEFVPRQPLETDTEKKIKGFASLKPGWNFGEGASFTAAQIERAIAIHRLFLQLGISITDAFPGLAGEISITGYKGGSKYYIEYTVVSEDLASFIARIDGVLVAKSLRVRPYEALRELVKVVGGIWNTLGSLTLNTTTTGDEKRSTETRWRLAKTEESRLCSVPA